VASSARLVVERTTFREVIVRPSTTLVADSPSGRFEIALASGERRELQDYANGLLAGAGVEETARVEERHQRFDSVVSLAIEYIALARRSRVRQRRRDHEGH
jgi:hypothetical protein